MLGVAETRWMQPRLLTLHQLRGSPELSRCITFRSLRKPGRGVEIGAYSTPWAAQPPPGAACRIRKPSPKCLQGAYIGDPRRQCKQKTAPKDRFNTLISLRKSGAGEGIRTLDPNLGKVVLYP